MTDAPILITVPQTLCLMFSYAFDPQEHDPDAPEGTERARSGAEAVFAVARRKGATEKLVQRVTKAFSTGINAHGIGAVEALMKVVSERDVADALLQVGHELLGAVHPPLRIIDGKPDASA